MVLRQFILSLLLISLPGCATLGREELLNQAELLELAPPKISIDFDVYLLRIDLNRQYTTQMSTSTESDGRMSPQTTSAPLPYHYLGVNLGNGVFLDANMNLSLNLTEILGFGKNDSFRIVEKGKGWFGRDTTWIKEGNEVSIDYGGLLTRKRSITIRENGAVFKRGILAGEQEILVEPSRITFDPHGILGDWSKSHIEATPTGAVIPGFWHNTPVSTMLEDGSIALGNSLSVRLEGKALRFSYSGWFGAETSYRLYRSRNRIVYADEKNRGLLIDILDGRVLVRYAMGGFSTDSKEFLFEKK